MDGFIQGKLPGEAIKGRGGEPVSNQAEWGEKIECRYKANLLNNRGRYDGGTFTQSSYEITIDDMSFNAASIRLFDSRGNLVCTKYVQSLEVLEFVQRIKITV